MTRTLPVSRPRTRAGIQHRPAALLLRGRAAGTSLVELMVAAAIGLLIVTTMAATFASSSQSRGEIDQAGQQIENGRYALEILRDDISMAGFYGRYRVSGAAPLEISPCAAALANMGWSNTGPTVPVWISGFSQGDAIPSGCTLTHLKSGTDVLVIRRVSTTPVTVATAGNTTNQSDFFLQVSSCSSDAQPAVFAAGGAGSGIFNLRNGDCSTVADLRKFAVHVYYVGTCSVCTGAVDTIPALRRLELSGGSIVDHSLVEGIEAMRTDFSLDSNGDGAPDTTRKCTSDSSQGARHCSAATLAKAMAVRVHLLARNLKLSAGHVDDKAYAMGLSGTIQPGGPYRRHAYSSLVVAMNPAGRVEP